jgi:hypothetical protein
MIKNRSGKRSYSVVAFLIVSSYLVGPSYGAEKIIKQETSGNQSPAVTATGPVTITYGMAVETCKALMEFVDSKNQNVDQLKKKLGYTQKVCKKGKRRCILSS